MRSKYILIVILFFFHTGSALARIDSLATIPKVPDSVPTYPGGNSALAKFIINKLSYRSMRESGILVYTFTTSFIVNENGKISTIKMNPVRGAYRDINRQIEKILKQMPDWVPGHTQKGDFEYFLVLKLDVISDEKNWIAVFPWNYLEETKRSQQLFNTCFNTGMNYAEDRNWEMAYYNFNKALEINGRHILSLYNRGIASFNLNDKKAACEDWNKIRSYHSEEANELIKKYCKNK